MRRVPVVVLSIATLVTMASVLAAEVIAPNANLKADGIPPIPATLATKVAPYTEFKPAFAVDWHPQKRELIIARRAGNVIQLHQVATPAAEPRQLTAFAEPVRFGAFIATKPDTLVFARDTGGNEQRQLYRLDPDAAAPVLLTDSARKHEAAAWTHARDRLLVESTDVDATGKRENPTTDLALLDLGTGKLEYFGEGGDWDVEYIALSPDGRTLAVITNEAGIGALRLYDADTRRALARPALPVGTVSGAIWHQNSCDLALSVASAQSPSDVYTIELGSH